MHLLHDTPRLSALIVGREAGAFALSCARSLRKGWLEAGYPARHLDVVVVDNASESHQRHWIQLLEAEGARVLVQSQDLGYAGGIEAAFGATRGSDDDFLAVLRPDVVFLPGAVGELVRCLEAHPHVGAVAPRAFLDEGRLLQHPPRRLAGVRQEIGRVLGRLSPRVARRRARRRTRAAQAWWSAEIPAAVDVLPGSCLFLSRAVAESLSVLMDKRFVGGYGDDDLSHRLRGRGLELYHHPRACVLHHGHDSLAAEPVGGKRWEVARKAYLERWSARLGRVALAGLERLARRWPEARLDRPAHELQRIKGPQPVELPLGREARWWIELSPDPRWEWSLVSAFDGDTWRLPEDTWSRLASGRWHLRALDRDSGRFGGAWLFSKRDAARSESVEFATDQHPELNRDWMGELSRTVRGAVGPDGWRGGAP